MTPVKLLVADVDGTLVTQDKVLTARACEAVGRLRAAGVAFVITSGRPPRGMAMLVEPLRLTTPIAAFNGGMVVQPDLVTVLEQCTLPLAVAHEVADYLLGDGVDVWVYRGRDWFIRDPSAPHVAREQATVQFAPTVIADVRSVLDGAVKIVGVSDDAVRLERCETELRARVGSHASAARSQPYYLDVTHPDANKGAVVRLAARLLKVPLEAIAAIGDMPNDVLMFGIAGTSIAMGNASREVQRTARYVTTSNEADGFANAIDRFILGAARTAPATLGLPAQSAPATLGLPPGTRACLFDLDGVLTQTAKLHAAAWKQMFDDFLRTWSPSHGQPFVPFDLARDYTLYVDGKLRIDGARSFLLSRGIRLPEDTVQELTNRKDRILLQLMQERGVETYGGSVRYVHAAHDAGLRTAAVSSSKHTRQAIAAADIGALFDAKVDGIIAAEQHLAGKPAPDTYIAAAHALGVDPAQAAVFEDSFSGVEAGRAGHFGYVVGVDRVGHGAELRRHGADVVVTDLAALLEQRP